MEGVTDADIHRPMTRADRWKLFALAMGAAVIDAVVASVLAVVVLAALTYLAPARLGDINPYSAGATIGLIVCALNVAFLSVWVVLIHPPSTHRSPAHRVTVRSAVEHLASVAIRLTAVWLIL